MDDAAIDAAPDSRRFDPADLVAAGRITAEDVAALRRNVFADGCATWSEAKLVLNLERTIPDKDPDWAAFYVDALTDFLVWKSEPKKYVSDDKAAFVLDHILHDGKVESATELELLVNVVHWSLSCPERLAVAALEAVRDSVLDPDHAAYGRGRRPGAIDEVDVELIRKVVYAPGSPGSFTVGRREAELLFELNDATAGATNAEGWDDLFVKAVASHLLFPKGPPATPSAEEALKREKWLAERRGVGTLLHAVGRTATGLDMDEFAAGWRAGDATGSERRRREIEAEEFALQEAYAREQIVHDEAVWLAGRVGASGEISPNERRLLAFILENAHAIDDALGPVISRAGV